MFNVLRVVTQIRHQLCEAGLRHVVAKQIRKPRALVVVQNKDYQIDDLSLTTDFALRIAGERSHGYIWACSNDDVLYEQNFPYRQTYLIQQPSDPRIVLYKSYTWPAALRKNLYTPLSPGIRALVLWDIA